MFWQLLLAHFIADYPLQTDWIVEAKRGFRGLALHVGIHFVVLLIVAGSTLSETWLYILGLTFIHYGIDFGKKKFSDYQPTLKLTGYFLDQLFHLCSIVCIAMFIFPESRTFVTDEQAVLGIGYLLVGHVWYVTERMISHANLPYQKAVQQQLWSRIVARSGLLTALLFVPTNWLFIVALAPFADWPYLAGEYHQRIWLTDISVVLVIFGFIQVML